jgi:hypothetical protein
MKLAVILLLLAASTPHPASAALVQWDLENVNSVFCVTAGGGCGPTTIPEHDMLTGHFTYNTFNDTITSWNIHSQSFDTWDNTIDFLPASNDSAIGTIEFSGLAGSEEKFVTLAMAAPDIPLLSGTSPITLLDTTTSEVPTCCGYDYTGTLVNDAVAPIPTTLPLFVTALLALGFVKYRYGRRASAGARAPKFRDIE